MAELVDPTLIALASERPLEEDRLRAGLARVAAHYAATAAGELEAHAWISERVALLCLVDSARRCRWPGFAEDSGHAIASAYIPTAWARRRRGVEPRSSALELARALAADPRSTGAELDAPTALAVADKRAARLHLANDPLGAGRLFEGRHGPTTIWSNRVAAIPLLAGERAEADPRAWRLFAAMGWFVREPTPIAGIARVPAGTAIVASEQGVERAADGVLASLVAPHPIPLDEHVARFAEESQAIARASGELFEERPRVDLSGGRDSRLVAAVFVSSGQPARFVTSDMTAGESDVARALFEALPGSFEHEVKWAGDERKSYDKGLRERALAIHLLHDGMRHASKVRGKMTLPPRPAAAASFSGHGGEIAHGFYYATGRQLAKLEQGGRPALVDRLERAARRRHNGAREGCYELARAEIEASLEQGAAHGVEGPALLDWFYLTERFAHRSGLAADAGRITFFSARSFLAAAFSLTPRERLADTFHAAATATLVPEWAEIPYFKPRAVRGSVWARLRGRLGRHEKRPRIWEGADGAELEAMIEGEGAWSELYEPDRVREIWRQARSGSADPHFQDVFEGIAFREAFEDYLELVSARAVEGQPLADLERHGR